MVFSQSSVQKLFEILEFFHSDKTCQGILISALDLQDSLEIESIETSAFHGLLAKTTVTCLQTLILMTQSISKYPYPIEKATNLQHILFAKLERVLQILDLIYS